jgi:serine/threonine protein kinase
MLFTCWLFLTSRLCFVGGNFLVDENLRVVVADFGLSERLKRGSSTWDQRGTYKGTVMFSAPENLKGSEFNELSDVYSVALVLWSLYTGQEPWKELGEDILYDDFVSKVLWDKVRPLISPGMRSRVPEYCALLEKCWADKPSDRPSIDKVVSSLNDILRKAAFAADPIAEQFWKRYFKDRDAVTIDELIGYLQHFLRGEMPQSRASERLLRYLLLEGETQSGYATMQQFGRVVWWFGPLPDINLAHVDATTNGLTMLVNAMLNICKNPFVASFGGRLSYLAKAVNSGF